MERARRLRGWRHELDRRGGVADAPAGTRKLKHTARRLNVDVAIVNAGGVRFGLTGPIDYTMTGADAVKLVGLLKPAVAIPAHYDGWSHFRDGEMGMRAAVRDAPARVREQFRWLPNGRSVDLTGQLNTAHHQSEGTAS